MVKYLKIHKSRPLSTDPRRKLIRGSRAILSAQTISVHNRNEVLDMAKKRLVLALGHDALGTNLPEQKTAVTKTAKAIADFIQDGWQVVITHGNTP